MSYKQWKDEPFYWAPTPKLGTKGWIAHKSSPKAPPAPDYEGAAEATAAGNLEAVRAQAEANRANQITPWGQVNWTKNPTGFDQASYDAAMQRYNEQNAAYDAWANQMREAGKNASIETEQGTQARPIDYTDDQLRQMYAQQGNKLYNAPNQSDYVTGKDSWTQTTTLTPELQQALDAQINIQNGRSQIANDQLAKLAEQFKTDFTGPDLAKYLEGLQGIDQTQLNANDYVGQLEKLRTDAPELAKYLEGLKAVNTDAPTYNPADADKFGQAAFDAQNTWLAPEYAKQEEALMNKYQLLGFDPRSQGAQQSMGSFNDSRNKAYNALAKDSLLTGQQVATGNFNNALAGFKAGNEAIAQDFTQRATAQQGDLAAFNAGNAARQNNYDNGIKAMDSQRANIDAANKARDQAYAQAMQKYQTQYAADYAKRVLPLNEINSLLTGQQVGMPQFSNYAQQGNAGGADYLSALQGQTNYDQGVYNAGAANAASGNAATGSALATVGSIAAIMF